MPRLVVSLVAFMAALWSFFAPAPVSAADAAKDFPAPYPALMDKVRALSAETAVMPVRIFALAREFAEAPDQERTASLMDAPLSRDKNPFVRRVAFTALRFMKRKDFSSINTEAMILRGLEDASAWVRYDAVWAGDVTGLDSPVFRTKLKELSGGVDPATMGNVAPSDSEGQLKKRAATLLIRLSGAAKAPEKS